MNTILHFPKQESRSGFSLEKEKQSLAVYLKRLARSGEMLVQATGFTLADQVVTHALVSAGVDFELYPTLEASRPDRKAVSRITLERYALTTFENGKSKCSLDEAMILEAGELLSRWDEAALVQYMLDHEVPVEPTDIPGSVSTARLAG